MIVALPSLGWGNVHCIPIFSWLNRVKSKFTEVILVILSCRHCDLALLAFLCRWSCSSLWYLVAGGRMVGMVGWLAPWYWLFQNGYFTNNHGYFTMKKWDLVGLKHFFLLVSLNILIFFSRGFKSLPWDDFTEVGFWMLECRGHLLVLGWAQSFGLYWINLPFMCLALFFACGVQQEKPWLGRQRFHGKYLL